MKRGLIFLAVGTLLGGAVATDALAQRGMGEAAGVARQAVRPKLVTFSGKVLAVETGPCGETTGRATIGTHFLLEVSKGKQRNVHLGPAAAVKDVADRLTVGKEVTVVAFRTDKMPEDHYVAQSLTVDGATIRLRAENLRPLWAGGGAGQPRQGDRSWAPGAGQGGAPGRGWDRGRGQGRGQGWGQGWGQGRGQGRGRGWGQGRSAM